MRTIALSLVVLTASACRPTWVSTLPLATDLGSPRGYRLARTIIHLHSPYSWDACDSNGLPDGKPNATCLAHLRDALCKNRVDAAFLTDHPSKMQDYEFSDLLLYQSGDTLGTENTLPVSNKLAGCSEGVSPLLSVGFESRIMAVGMTQHLDPSPTVRGDLYSAETSTVVQRLKNEAGAVVIVPHTESRTADTLSGLGMDAIEIYNIHANLDPKIRGPSLGLEPYTGALDLMVYWLDPYREQTTDLALVSFFQIADVYFSQWHKLIAAGKRVTGVGGSDAHENILPYTAADGERVDSFRRVMRWISNHWLVPDVSLSSLKTAIRAGRGWLVVEGLGSPSGMDFYAKAGASTIGVGEAGTYVSGGTQITVKAPSLHSGSPQFGSAPTIRLKLIRIDSDATSTTVATSEGKDLVYDADRKGAYRAEVRIVPAHLKAFMNYHAEKAAYEYPWVVTNPLYLD